MQLHEKLDEKKLTWKSSARQLVFQGWKGTVYREFYLSK